MRRKIVEQRLSVDHVEGMDEIKRKLTDGRTEPKHLHTRRIAVFGDNDS